MAFERNEKAAVDEAETLACSCACPNNEKSSSAIYRLLKTPKEMIQSTNPIMSLTYIYFWFDITWELRGIEQAFITVSFKI